MSRSSLRVTLMYAGWSATSRSSPISASAVTMTLALAASGSLGPSPDTGSGRYSSSYPQSEPARLRIGWRAIANDPDSQSDVRSKARSVMATIDLSRSFRADTRTRGRWGV